MKKDKDFIPDLDEFSIAFLNLAENTNECIYLEWKWGTWKSTLIDYFKNNTKKKVAYLWTTWPAAINIQGQTVHSFFNMTPNNKFKTMGEEKRQYIKDLDIIVIDEVSMKRADQYDALDKILRMIMQIDEPMWGKQVIFVWDLLQLSPVPESEFFDREKTDKNPKYKEYNDIYNWLFFFDWIKYIQDHFKIVSLQKIHRQKAWPNATQKEVDEANRFKDMLNRMRMWDDSKDLLDYFNERVVKPSEINKKAILISPLNSIVKKVNEDRLSMLHSEKRVSWAVIKWEFPEDLYPTDKCISAKVWARIVFIRNEKTWIYANWTLWEIINIWDNYVEVQIDWWIVEKIEKVTWKNVEWVNEFWEDIIIWTFIQYPFVLWFALTIHKAQWKTFENVVIDRWWGFFADWMAYTAWSRWKNLNKIQLTSPMLAKDIKASLRVRMYLRKNK